ncbi:MAG: PD-(D/E)XK nuclease family protein [Rickettsiaceae bacterium]
MTIFWTNSKSDFLEDLAQFAIKNYADNFSRLKIILSSGLACSVLQKIIVSKLGACILPDIISLGELAAESEEIFKIPSEQIGSVSRLEEKIILAQTIYEYQKLGYDQTQCLRLAPSLAHLFFDFEINDINIEDLRDLPTLNQSEHWYKIYDFLLFAFHNWHAKIQSLSKATRAAYQKLQLAAELARLNNNRQTSLIIAGIRSGNLATDNFIKQALESGKCHLVLPPFPNKAVQDAKAETRLYKIHKLLQFIGGAVADLNPASKASGSIVEKLISDSASQNMANKISHIEFENIFHEAEYIALKCKDLLNKKPDNKIAIIAHNQRAKEQYCFFLDKYSLVYQDHFGQALLQLHPISFTLLVAEQLCCEFDLGKFFTFLSHPLMNSAHAQGLKNIIRKENRFVSSLKNIGEIIDAQGDRELVDYFALINEVLSKRPQSAEFTLLCRHVIEAAEKIIPDIWQKHQGIIEPLKELCQLKGSFLIIEQQDFPEILKQALEGGRLFETNSAQQIIITRPNNSTLVNYDSIIITEMNEGSCPTISTINPWINSAMQQKLNLDSNQSKMDEALYDFYLNLQNPEVTLTRSKRDSSNKQTLPSPFILNLKHILGDKLKTTIGKLEEPFSAEPPLPCVASSTGSTVARSADFPDQLYATDIETLIRAPYNFYAKKILKLRKIEEIDQRPNLAEFGNFFHSVVEQYTKAYQPFLRDQKSHLMEVADSVLASSNIPSHSKRAWKIKFTALADEFITFDCSRRQNLARIFSEIEGTTEINVNGRLINIKAIADRIEVDNQNIATILDYKTGSVPTKKDILSGLSPQMLVEAIILSAGGFDIGTCNIAKLVYVKIGSSSPYISTTELAISAEDIDRHKQGLTRLLEHYVQTHEFPIEQNLMKYDDYKHLARRA